MEFLKFIAGTLGGFLSCWTLVWLIFVYPFSNISLKWLWWGIPFGVVLGIGSIFGLLTVAENHWPRD